MVSVASGSPWGVGEFQDTVRQHTLSFGAGLFARRTQRLLPQRHICIRDARSMGPRWTSVVFPLAPVSDCRTLETVQASDSFRNSFFSHCVARESTPAE